MATCRHTWTKRVAAVMQLDARGWPTGHYLVQETRFCQCGAFSTRYVPNTRAGCAKAALVLYEQQKERA